MSRNLSAFSSITLSVGREYSDSSDEFRLSQTLTGVNNTNIQSAVQSGAPFTTTHAQVAWNFQRARTGLGFSVEAFKDTYQQPSVLDENRLQAEVHASRRLTPNLEVRLIENYFHQHFMDIPGTATETTSEAQLVWHAGRRLSVSVDFSRSNRHGDSAATNFTENRGWVRLAWGRPAQQPVRPVAPRLPGEAFRP